MKLSLVIITFCSLLNSANAEQIFNPDTSRLAVRVNDTVLQLMLPKPVFLKAVQKKFPEVDSIEIYLLPYSKRTVIMEIRAFGAMVYPRKKNKAPYKSNIAFVAYLKRDDVVDEREYFVYRRRWQTGICRGEIAHCSSVRIRFYRNGADRCICGNRSGYDFHRPAMKYYSSLSEVMGNVDY